MSTPQPTESNTMEHESTRPPPLPGNPSNPDSTGQWFLDKLKAVRRESSEADDKATKANEKSTEALSIAKEIKATIGTPSNQALGIPGNGLTGVIERVLVEIQTDRAAAQADRAEQAKRNDWALWAVKIVVGALLVAGTGGSIAWIVGLHH